MREPHLRKGLNKLAEVLSPHVSPCLPISPYISPAQGAQLEYKLAEVSSTDPCPNPNTNPNQVFQPYSAADYKSLFA